jgi:hypothetical protein
VGRVYQQTVINTYAKVALGELYDRKTPITRGGGIIAVAGKSIVGALQPNADEGRTDERWIAPAPEFQAL